MKEEYLKLNDGSRMPRLGMGTWYLGENKAARKQEIEALRAGIHAGCSLIDTAEMYGSGKSEQLRNRQKFTFYCFKSIST